MRVGFFIDINKANMKLIISGGRTYNFTDKDLEFLYNLTKKYEIVEIISGGAKGADSCAEEFANLMEIPFSKFPANWKKYKKSAGYIRNKEMAKNGDAVVLFPGNKGTNMMYEIAKGKELKIFDRRQYEN